MHTVATVTVVQLIEKLDVMHMRFIENANSPIDLSRVSFVRGKCIVVLSSRQARDGLRSIRRNLDSPHRSLSSRVPEEVRSSAVRARALLLLLRSLQKLGRTPSTGVEPVQELCLSSSTVPALGAGTKDLEEERGAAVAPAVTLSLRTVGKVVELSREPEPGGEGATADGTTVTATERVSAAGHGGRIAVVVECIRCGSEESEGESEESCECVHC